MSEAGTASQAALMDGIYRGQRHIYDMTRKYYLFGRGAEQYARAGTGSAGDLRPQLVELAVVHPVLRIEQDIAVVAARIAPGEVIHHIGMAHIEPAD